MQATRSSDGLDSNTYEYTWIDPRGKMVAREEHTYVSIWYVESSYQRGASVGVSKNQAGSSVTPPWRADSDETFILYCADTYTTLINRLDMD